MRGAAVKVSEQTQHFNSQQYSCVSSKLSLQTGGGNVKNILLASFRRSFMLECVLRKLPCNFLKLSVLEISPAHLHPISSSGAVLVFLCFNKTQTP